MSGSPCLLPRPPVPGSESPPDVFVESPLPPRSLPLSPLKPRPAMAPSPKATSESGSLRGFEPEGSADVTPPFSESSASGHSAPAYLRWAENLHNLLSDPDGVELYKCYLKTENVGELLDFWFACEGLKRLPSDQGEKIYQLIKVINRKFLRSKAVPVLEETRKAIQEKVGSKTDIDQSIFDNAQMEVEERMTRTTYRNFLGSEMYLNYIQAQQTGPEVDFSPKNSGSHSTESSLSGRAVHPQDDSGHFSSAAPEGGERSKSGQSTRPPTSLLQGSSSSGSGSTSGVSEASSMPSGHHPAPASLPSGPAHNTSLANTSLANTSANTSQVPREEGRETEQQAGPPAALHQAASHSALPTLHEDSELDCQAAASTLPSLPSSLITSLTSQPLNMAKRRHHAKPEAQAGLYLSGGGRVPPHPYHAYNSAYNPVSRQDSELQSVSSHNDTTDDNGSSFTESSSHYSNSYRSLTNKKYIRRQAKRMQEQSRHNREAGPGGHSGQGGAASATAFIPRTARVPTEASNQLPPSEFAAVLTGKLEKLKREQDINEKLQKKLSEENGSLVSQASSRSLADILREKLIVPTDNDEEFDQSILDDHVSRVWTDKTPLRSPGDPSGRPRSPGFGRRGARGSGQGPRGAAQGPRGPVAQGRGPAGRGPPVRGPPAGPVYHQDLAYYPDPAGRQLVPLEQPGPANDRVLEWMLDVERSGGPGGQDQRSHSSRGAGREPSRTSPRSKARHGGHRSASQERSQMSTSWAGHPQGAIHYQAQLESESKRRAGPGSLSQSMAMPPPSVSNNSTLRRAAGQVARGQQPVAVPGEVTVAVYTFSHERGEPMPYRVKIPARQVSLRNVKEFLPKKGAFRFYFKTEVDGDMCYEEETEDSSLVPLWEGKVLVQCRMLD